MLNKKSIAEFYCKVNLLFGSLFLYGIKGALVKEISLCHAYNVIVSVFCTWAIVDVEISCLSHYTEVELQHSISKPS